MEIAPDPSRVAVAMTPTSKALRPSEIRRLVEERNLTQVEPGTPMQRVIPDNPFTRTGYTYGALATPIAFLLFAFFLGFAIMIGAELNAAIEEEWPAPPPHLQRWRERAQRGGPQQGDTDQSDEGSGAETGAGPVSTVGEGHPEPAAVSPS